MTSKYSENSKFSLRSVVSNKLKSKEIKEICLLKDKQWRFGLKSQFKWFTNNIKKYDLHNLFYIRSELVGYTLLRKRTFIIKNSNKKKNYLLFDTLIIDKKYRGMNFSDLLMRFNNAIINQSGFFSFLICKDELISFYKRNQWKKLNKLMFSIKDHPFSSNGMVFNKKIMHKKISFYINN